MTHSTSQVAWKRVGWLHDSVVVDTIDLGSAPDAVVQFIGVVASGAFDEVRVDESGAGGDEISISNFRFATAVPLPGAATLGLSALGVLGTAARRRPRRGIDVGIRQHNTD